jgi:type VI protein secretion system component VasK
MSRERSLITWLVLALAMLWVIGLALRCRWWWLAAGTVLTVACGIGAYLIWRRLQTRHLDPSASDPGAAVRAEHAVVMRLLRRAGAEAEPWIVVLGAAWSGKTSALTSAGAVPLEVPQPSMCRWWRMPRALYIEPPARWFEDPAAVGERRALLAVLKRRRRCPGIAGTLVVVSLGELLSQDEAAIEATAQRISRMQAGIEAALDARIPVWLLLMKSDLLGGFRDFAAGLTDAERRAPFGARLDPDTAAPAIADALGAMAETARAHRLRTLRTAASDGQARKAYQFPGQLLVALRWVGDLALKLTAGADGTAVRLRGIHLASGLPAGPPAEAVSAAGTRTRFFDTAEFHFGAEQPAAVAHDALFLRELLADAIPADDQAVPSPRRIRRRRWSQRMCAMLAPALAGLVAIAIVVQAGRVADLAHASRHALVTAREAVGGDPAHESIALEPLAARLACAAGMWGGRPVRERLEREYYAGVDRLFVAPCVSRLERELRQQPSDGDAAAADRLALALRAYRFLGGDADVDLAEIHPFLTADARWCAGFADADARLHAAADRHLAFLLEHAGSTQDWAVPVDHALIEHLEVRLADSLCIAQTYHEIEVGASGAFPAIRADELADGAGREHLEATGEVPGPFTQGAWDAALAREVHDRAGDLSRRLDAVGILRRAGDLERRLAERHGAEHRRRWLALLRGMRVAGTTDARDLPGCLTSCAGPQSAYRAFVRAALGGSRLRGVPGGASTPADWRWLDEALRPLAELATEIERYLAATEAGHRSSAVPAVRELARAFDAAFARASTAVEPLEDATDRAAVRDAIHGLMQSALSVLTRDLLDEQEQAWTEGVSRAFAAELANRYPFAPDAAVDAEPAMVSRMFNPTCGSFWRTVSTIESLRALHALGVELLPVSRPYLELLSRATALRDALYPDGRSSWVLRFRLTLCLREGTTDVHVAIGDQSAGVYDHPDRSADFSLDEGRPANARVVLRTVAGQVLTCDALSGPWSPMRLIRQGEPTPRADGSWSCTWSVRADAIGREAVLRASARLASDGCGAVLAGDILTGMKCPATIRGAP